MPPLLGPPFEALARGTSVPSPAFWPEMKEGFSLTAKDKQRGIPEGIMPGGGRARAEVTGGSACPVLVRARSSGGMGTVCSCFRVLPTTATGLLHTCTSPFQLRSLEKTRRRERQKGKISFWKLPGQNQAISNSSECRNFSVPLSFGISGFPSSGLPKHQSDLSRL